MNQLWEYDTNNNCNVPRVPIPTFLMFDSLSVRTALLVGLQSVNDDSGRTIIENHIINHLRRSTGSEPLYVEWPFTVKMFGWRKEEYFGVTVRVDPGSNARVLMRDFTVSHNSSTVELICHIKNITPISLDASDQRRKADIETKLITSRNDMPLSTWLRKRDPTKNNKQQDTTLLRPEEQFFQRTLIVADEIDGMHGTQDRGGVQAVIRVVRDEGMRAIFISNSYTENAHIKALVACRSQHNAKLPLVQPIAWNTPSEQSIVDALRFILRKEHVTEQQISVADLLQLVRGNPGDVRQAIHRLQMLVRTRQGGFGGNIDLRTNDGAVDLFDATRSIFNRKMSLEQRLDLAFQEQRISLMVQQHYISYIDPARQVTDRPLFIVATDMMSLGDTLDQRIREDQDYSIQPLERMLSSAIPTHLIATQRKSTHAPYSFRFPQFLQNFSTATARRNRCLDMSRTVRIAFRSFAVDMAPAIAEIARVRLDSANFDVSEMVEWCRDVGITRENIIEHLHTLKIDEGDEKGINPITTRNKAAFTREWNRIEKERTSKPKPRNKKTKTKTKTKTKSKTSSAKTKRKRNSDEAISSAEEEEEDDVSDDAPVARFAGGIKRPPSKKVKAAASVKKTKTTTSFKAAAIKSTTTVALKPTVPATVKVIAPATLKQPVTTPVKATIAAAKTKTKTAVARKDAPLAVNSVVLARLQAALCK